MKPKFKLLIYLKHRYPFWCIKPEQVEVIRKKFPQLSIATVFEESDAIREIQDAEYYFGWHMPLSILNAAQKLQWIHTPSAGRDYIDSPELRKRSIEFTNSEGYHGIFMAQHAIGMMLYFAKSLHLSKKQFWPRHEVAEQFFDLNQAKVLIVGCGSIGLKLVDLCQAFGLQVSGYRRHIPTENSKNLKWIGPSGLKQAIQESKFVVNLLPGTEETLYFFNKEKFSYFSKGSIFINLGRGRTVDENALLELLSKDVLLGCGLDVLENEPPKETHPLFEKENVLITPHSSAFSYQYLDHAVMYFCDELLKRQKG